MDQERALFRFQLGQGVRWAATPTRQDWVERRRWTERAILGPVVEYHLGLDVGWVYEADLTAWDAPDAPSIRPH
jgi:hypothetical protein